MDCGFYKDSQAVHLWFHLVMKATHKPIVSDTELGEYPLSRGQLITGRHRLSSETGIKPDRVQYLLKKFVSMGMISTDSNRKFTVITVQKYDDYQANFFPTDSQQIPNAKPRGTRAKAEVVPTDSQQIPTYNKQLNTNNKNLTSENSHESSDEREKKLLPALRSGAAIQSPNGKLWGTPEDLQAAQWIFGLVQQVNPTASEPNWHAWANDIRLMRRALQADHRRICQVFKWANHDHFWQTNILCPAKLRDKWETLTARMQQQPKAQASAPAAGLDFNNTDWAKGMY